MQGQRRLENLAQHLLNQLAWLAREQADILKAGDQPRIQDLEKRLEKAVGEKERALGALKQHRSEHHC